MYLYVPFELDQVKLVCLAVAIGRYTNSGRETRVNIITTCGLSRIAAIPLSKLKWHREPSLRLARWTFGGSWGLILGLILWLVAASAPSHRIHFSQAEPRFWIRVRIRLYWSSLSQMLDFSIWGLTGRYLKIRGYPTLHHPRLWVSKFSISYSAHVHLFAPIRRGSRLRSSRRERGFFCEFSSYMGTVPPAVDEQTCTHHASINAIDQADQ